MYFVLMGAAAILLAPGALENEAFIGTSNFLVKQNPVSVPMHTQHNCCSTLQLYCAIKPGEDPMNNE